jgi:hypothetical protein
MPLNLSPDVEAKLRRKCPDEFTLYESIGVGGAHTPLPPKPKPE